MALTQKDRSAKLFTSLSPDKLCLVEVAARESLGRLFDCEVHAVSEDRDIDLDQLIGQPCHVELDRGVSGKRIVHGLLAEGDWLRIENELAHYRLVLRPWFWLLDKTSDCRIHHDRTVLDIVRETFARHGFSDFRVATTHDYPVLHYTVQYRETDFHFLSRLLELHGIYYYFEHSAQAHTLVLCDGPASHLPVPALDDVVYVSARDAEHSMRRQTIQSWKLKRALRSGRSAVQDFNHLTPNAQMLGDATAASSYAHGDLEIYDYPGPHAKRGDGVRYAKVRLEAEQAADKRREAAGYVVTAFAGAPLTLDWHPRQSENGKYLIVGTSFRYGPQYYWSQDDGTDAAYRGDYDLLPFDAPFRTPPTTPKPRIPSLQTAIVVGQSGEEIDCDDHGRILVHFHWDRHGDKSCRVRVSQVWSGQGWGGQVIPRIGMEVMVAFLEGDPDRPIVVGCVPDPINNTVPYSLPENKTRMVWRSNSHKSSGFNELAFEDKTGGENVFLNASKDKTVRVRNNHTERVDANQVSSVGANQAVEVGGHQKTEVAGSMNLTVGGAGAGALALMGQLAGLAPITAGLLQQAGDIAGGGAAMGGMAASLASSALGFLGGGGLGARQGVVAGSEPRADAGTALASSGTGVGEAASGLFGMSGVMNTVVGAFKTDSVGVARVEQVGLSKVTNVGATSLENVGKFKKIAVGEEFVIEVGDSKFIMKKDGSVIILGKTFNFIATDHFQMRGKPIDLN